MIKHKHQTTLLNDDSKDVSANAWNDEHVDANGNTVSITPIDKTHAELSAMATGATLVPGQLYRITNFRTYHLIPNTTDYNTGSTEVLIVRALTSSTIDKLAMSESYPQDVIYYELVDSSTMGGDRGRIYFRHDTAPTKNIAVWEDWRARKYRRWNTQADGLGTYTVLTDNGFPSQDYFMFNNSATPADTNDVSIAKGMDFPEQINCVFMAGTSELFALTDFAENTFVGACTINVIHSVYFHGNTAYGVFSACHIDESVYSCTFAQDFNNAHIGTYMDTVNFPSNNGILTRIEKGYSNFPVTIAIATLTTLDITANNALFAGIINITSTNAAETINKILNQPISERWDYELRPEADLTLTLTGTAYAAVNADGQILLGAATRVLDGAKRDSIKLRRESITNGNGTFVVAREVGVSISS